MEEAIASKHFNETFDHNQSSQSERTAALHERPTITSEKATTDARIYPHRSSANDTPLLRYKLHFINDLWSAQPAYRDKDSARFQSSVFEKGYVALTKAVSGLEPPSRAVTDSREGHKTRARRHRKGTKLSSYTACKGLYGG